MTTNAPASAPDRIWLQTGGDNYPADHEGVSWCWHNVHGNDVEYVRADLAARAHQRETEWLPIETAPRDSTRILVANEHKVAEAEFCGVMRGFTAPNEEYRPVKKPTHWRPLPAAPSRAQGRGA